MRLTLATAPLLDAVGLASAVASPKSPKRILECVAIRASRQDGVRIEASDLDVTLGLRLEDIVVEEEGTVAVPASRLVSVLREVANDALVIALKGAAPELRDKILKNMSQRAAEALREDLESRGPVRVSDVETQQKEILKVVRRLADAGEIAIGGGGEDAFV